MTNDPDDRVVKLTDGYEVDLAEEAGLENLFQAILASRAAYAAQIPDIEERGLVLYDLCVLEVHYVAGQLHARGSSIDLRMLVEELRSFWVPVKEQMDRKGSE